MKRRGITRYAAMTSEEKKENNQKSMRIKREQMLDTNIYTLEQLEKLLTERQKTFCHIYINDYNGTQAYIKAYNTDNYFAAASSASGLLSRPKIKQYIVYIKENIAEEVGFSKIGLLKELNAIATANLPEMYTSWIELDQLETVKKNYPKLCKAIKQISTKTETKMSAEKEPIEVNYVKIEVHDKISAIRDIFKVMGWNEPELVKVVTEQPLFPDVSY